MEGIFMKPSNTSSVRVSPEPTAPEPVAASGQEEGTMVTLTEPISEDHAPYKEKKQNKKMLADAEGRLKEKQATRPTVEATIEKFKEQLAEPWYLVNPEGKFMQRWDAVTTSALIFTAVVTPYEVACLSSQELVVNVLWIINQMVNLVFVADMVISFHTIYRESAKNGSGLVKDLDLIREKYVRGWFTIDLVSIIPFSYIPGASQLGILRMIRILRLLKLARVLRASRIYQRYQQRNSLPHAVEAMFKLALLLCTLAHWMACAWIMTATLQGDNEYTWLDNVAETFWCGGDCEEFPARKEALKDPSLVYYSALYWSVVTVTSVGYGDISARNTVEMLFCTIYLLIGATVWAYIIGNAVTIISTGDPDQIAHHQLMDALNRYIAEKELPEPIRFRLRRFFRSRREMTKQHAHQDLIEKLSPKLMEDVCESTAAWLRGVSYLRDPSISTSFLVNISSCLTETIYEPREIIRWNDSLNGISRGVASVQGRICPVGFIWGEDFVLTSFELKDKRPANALTYVTVLVLERAAFFRTLARYPIEKRVVRKAICFLAFRRAVLAYAFLNAETSNFSGLIKQVASADAVAPIEQVPATIDVGSTESSTVAPLDTSAVEKAVAESVASLGRDIARANKDTQERIEKTTAGLASQLSSVIQKLNGSQAPPGGAPPPLPAGWAAAFDPATKAPFYVNTQSGEKSWERPV